MARRERDGASVGLTSLLLVLTAPLLVFVAAVGTRLDVWGWTLGYKLLTMQIGLALAAFGLIVALWRMTAAHYGRVSRGSALAGLLIASITMALYGAHIRATGLTAWTGRTDTPPFQATTDRADPPAFATRLADRRDADQAAPATRYAGFQSCDAQSVPRQVAPGEAAWALEQAGFDVLGFGVGRADGTRQGFWFGFTHDATIRIRPGRTDVRVAAREARPDGQEACRLTQRIVSELQAKR